jgi:hypothetical protein
MGTEEKHKCNNLLCAISGYIQLAMDEKNEAVRQDHMKKADDFCKELSKYIGSTKDFSTTK